jgi:hypothetical protein
MGGPQYGGGNPYGGPGYYGNQDPRNTPGVVQPQEFQNTYQQALRSLQQLQQQTGNDTEMSKDLQNLIREMQRTNPYTYANDPLLNERINQALLGNVQQVEMELRRKLEEANGSSVRSPGSEKVPAGYADKVAEYYRKLSKGK